MHPEPQLLSAMRGGSPSENLSRLRVLIVDDNRDGANSLSDLLALSGAVAMVRYDGAAAVAAAVEMAFDVVILDLTMPQMDGCEAATRIRLAVSPVPFLIALSGRVDDRTRERVAQCGFDLHFAKPMDPGELLHALNTISRVLNARHAKSSGEAGAVAP